MIRTVLQTGAAAAVLFGVAWAQTEPGSPHGYAMACSSAVAVEGAGQDAIRTCTQALDQEAITPVDRAATLVNRGVIYLATGEAQLALADFDGAIVAQPSLSEAYTQRGLAQLMLRNYQAAITDITQGLSMTPGPAEPHKAHYSRAVAYEELGNIRAAYADYRRASELAPDWELPRTELSRFQVRPANPG